MSTYAISFHLEYNSTYTERYTSLMAAIRQCAKVWEETTSFAIVETHETLDTLERRLWLSQFSSATDILMVIDISYDSCTIRGAAKKRAILKSILPQVQEK